MNEFKLLYSNKSKTGECVCVCVHGVCLQKNLKAQNKHGRNEQTILHIIQEGYK